jgi:hypothetical protein
MFIQSLTASALIYTDMTQNKSWNDLTSEDKIYRTGYSSWYVDHGVKIELFDFDNRIEIMNTMTSSDKYEKIDEFQMLVFENNGWLAGCYNLNVDVCERKIKKVESLIRYAEMDSDLYNINELTERKQKLLIKKDRYSLLLSEIL